MAGGKQSIKSCKTVARPIWGRGGKGGGRQWLGPGISEAFVLGLTKLCRHTVLPQCCPVATAHQPIGGTCKAEDREAGNGDERKRENMRGRLGRRRRRGWGGRERLR